MSTDRLSFLSDQTEEPHVEEVAAEPTPVEESAPPPEAEAPPGPARDEKGRFAPTGETTGATPAPDQKERHVPLNAMLDERDRRKAAEMEAARWRQQVEEMQRRSQPQQIPDPVENPQGYQLSIEQVVAARLDMQEAQISERFARQKFGDEAVNAALEAAEQSGAINHFRSGPDRWSNMVQWHQAQSTLNTVGNLSDYQARIEAEIRAKLEAEYAAKYNPAPPPVPPGSLAAAPGSPVKGPVTMGDAESFTHAFRRRPIG